MWPLEIWCKYGHILSQFMPALRDNVQDKIKWKLNNGVIRGSWVCIDTLTWDWGLLKWYWKEESKWRTVFWLSTYWNSWRPDHCSTELIIWPMVCGYYAFIPVLNCNNGVLLDHQESHLILTPQGYVKSIEPH